MGGDLISTQSSILQAQSNTRKLELRGKILLPPGVLRPRRWVSVSLYAVGTPFYRRTFAQQDGRFKFGGLEPGTYTILFALPRVGELSQTLEITRSFADPKGRIERQFEYTPEQMTLLLRPDEGATVSVRELKISFGARREFEKAQASLREMDSDRAMEHLKRAIELSPEFEEAINTLGIIYFQRKDYEQAEKQFRQALKLDDEADEPRLNLGGALLTQGKAREALKENQLAYDAAPQDALAAAQLGLSHYLLADYGQAINYLNRAKELDPAHFTFPQITLAQIYLRLDQPEDAVDELTEFLKLHPDSVEVSRVRELMGAAEEAVRRRARQTQPDGPF